MELSGPTAAPATIQLYALLGSFSVRGSPVNIRFASTFGSPTRDDGHKALLNQLLPMRDRASPCELRNLDSLLQRDLNDARVGQELIPYLEGTSKIGFFPAILGILLPRGYLQAASQGGMQYPKPTTSGNGTTVYEGRWSVTQYTAGDQTLPFGLLEIDPDKTDLVVLDGQHRAVAFRYVAGQYQPGDIHEVFYHRTGQEPLAADLPVTLIWFESDVEIDPQLVSRQLFVDVNNNAQAVSDSRTILLDDRSVPALATQSFFNWSAERGFASDQFSLLNGAFDIDADWANAQLPATALTAPPIIHDTVKWALFSSGQYDEVSRWKVTKLHEPQSMGRFERLFSDYRDVVRRMGPDEERGRVACLVDSESAESFRTAFAERYRGILTQLFDHWHILHTHYRACAATETWARENKGGTYREVWKRILAGGEGLYLSVRRARPEGEKKELVGNYQKVLSEIEEELSRKRDELVGSSESAVNMYRAIRTKSFQIGYVMAVDHIARDFTDGDYKEAAEDLVSVMNEYSGAEWVAVFDQMRRQLLGKGVEQRVWPADRNILLRLYDENGGDIFDLTNWQDAPEGRLIREIIIRRAGSIAEEMEEMPEDKEIRHRAKSVLREVKAIAGSCGLATKHMDEKEYIEGVVTYFKGSLDEYFQPE